MTNFVSTHTCSASFCPLIHVVFRSALVLYIQPVRDDAERIIFIKNISFDKARELCNTWKKHSRVVNFLPLLNKVQTLQMCLFQWTWCPVGHTRQSSRALLSLFSRRTYNFHPVLMWIGSGFGTASRNFLGKKSSGRELRMFAHHRQPSRQQQVNISDCGSVVRIGTSLTNVNKDDALLLFVRQWGCCRWNHDPANEFHSSKRQRSTILDHKDKHYFVPYSLSLVHHPR